MLSHKFDMRRNVKNEKLKSTWWNENYDEKYFSNEKLQIKISFIFVNNSIIHPELFWL